MEGYALFYRHPVAGTGPEATCRGTATMDVSSGNLAYGESSCWVAPFPSHSCLPLILTTEFYNNDDGILFVVDREREDGG